MTLPAALDGTALRILATSDLGANTVPLRTSYGESGTCAGVVSLLEAERERQPTICLDVGDLVVGSPAYPLLGERPWSEVADLPIAAAAVGNHEFDDGVDPLLEAVPRLSFPLLCANVDVGLPGSALLDTEAWPVGVIGLTHPASDELSQAPPIGEWSDQVRTLARDLRRDGARWVVALLHDGVEWWPSGEAIATRSDRLEAVAQPWAAEIDLILAGHNFGSWVGALGGTPAAEPHLFAASLAVIDLFPEPVVRGVHRKRSTGRRRASLASSPRRGSPARARSATSPTSSPRGCAPQPAPTPPSSCRASTAPRHRSTARSRHSGPARSQSSTCCARRPSSNCKRCWPTGPVFITSCTSTATARFWRAPPDRA